MSEPITWNDFEKVQIKAGTIIDVADFLNARKPAYQLTIDFGADGVKRSSAQITHHYTKEELIGIGRAMGRRGGATDGAVGVHAGHAACLRHRLVDFR